MEQEERVELSASTARGTSAIAEMWSSKLTSSSAHRNTVAAASGSFVSTIAGFPLDSIKSRLQVKR